MQNLQNFLNPQMAGTMGALGVATLMRMFRREQRRRERGVERQLAPKKRKLIKAPPKTKDEAQDRAIKDIKTRINLDTGTHVHRIRACVQQLATVNEATYRDLGVNDASNIEDVLSNLKYYDPSTPATLLTADGAVGTFSKSFHFTSIHNKFTVRNNFISPVNVRIYYVAPKSDTSILPSTAFTNGLADVGSPSATSPLTYLTDSPVFNKLWKIVKSQKATLQGGQTRTMSHTIKDIKYDPAYNDSHTSSYKPIDGALRIIVRVTGAVGHTATTVGHLACGVDITSDTVYTVKYQAGADLYQITLSDTSGAVTTASLFTDKPVGDNIVYNAA